MTMFIDPCEAPMKRRMHNHEGGKLDRLNLESSVFIQMSWLKKKTKRRGLFSSIERDFK
jgi:hypothetical protein